MAVQEVRLRARDGAGRCGFCRAPLGETTLFCHGCGVVLHAACWDEQRVCPTLGCVGAARGPLPAGSRPRPGDETTSRRTAGRRAETIVLLALLVPVLLITVGLSLLVSQLRRAQPAPPAASAPRPEPVDYPSRLGEPGLDLLHPVLADAAWYAAAGGGKPDMVLAGLRLRWLAVARDGLGDPWAECAPGAAARVRLELTGREERVTHELTLTLQGLGPDGSLVRVQDGHSVWVERWAPRPAPRSGVRREGPVPGLRREIEGVLREGLSGVQGQFATGERLYAFAQPGLPLPWRAAIRQRDHGAALTLLEWSPAPAPTPAPAMVR